MPEKIDFLNQSIKRASHNKFLGIILDEHLTWNNHISELSSKLKDFFTSSTISGIIFLKTILRLSIML